MPGKPKAWHVLVFVTASYLWTHICLLAVRNMQAAVPFFVLGFALTAFYAFMMWLDSKVGERVR